jgi:hypothetical protein
MTLGLLPSMMATQELVVPKSIPIILENVLKLWLSYDEKLMLAWDMSCLPIWKFCPLNSDLIIEILCFVCKCMQKG